ncbi:MAG: branched-chain amino acid ABC transporter permease [Alphaproteobacteria bacterium]|nr:branched-chain amino acid ABC transporter permease [Alphaproteobacteria bacterium]
MALFPQFVIDSLLQGGLYVLIAVGLSLGFGVTRIINFAQGEFVMLGAYGAFWLLTLCGIDPILAIPLLIVAGFCAGWLLFQATVRRVLEAPALNQIMLTFGIALVLQNLAVMLWTGDLRSASPAYATETWSLGTVVIIRGRVIAAGVAVLLVAAVLVWLRLTETGRAVRAVAQNRDAATLLGIDPLRIYALSFAVVTALGVAAGAVVSFLINITPFMGFPILLKAIAIVVLGGLGSLAGTVVGALVLAFVETAVSYYVPEGPGWTEGIGFALIVAILVLRPSGIAGHSVAA